MDSRYFYLEKHSIYQFLKTFSNSKRIKAIIFKYLKYYKIGFLIVDKKNQLFNQVDYYKDFYISFENKNNNFMTKWIN